LRAAIMEFDRKGRSASQSLRRYFADDNETR
jgi:hypothetical protein